MDVARPLTVLVPSLDGPVLEALARTSRPVTGREAHRLAGAGSESGVRLVLARLVEHGLVNATQAGKATLYVANREHIAWPLVEGLVNLRRELFARMGKLIAAWSSPPATVTVLPTPWLARSCNRQSQLGSVDHPTGRYGGPYHGQGQFHGSRTGSGPVLPVLSGHKYRQSAAGQFPGRSAVRPRKGQLARKRDRRRRTLAPIPQSAGLPRNRHK